MPTDRLEVSEVERTQIRQILNIPDSLFVSQQIDRANLRPREKEAVRLREIEGLSITEAAEQSLVCETIHKEQYKKGMEKLNACWSGLPYIEGARRMYFKQ